MQHIDYIFKVPIVGSQGVGKSALMTRYVDQIFIDSYLSTIGVDFKIKTIHVRDKWIKLQIWDTAGQERFAALTQQHFRGAHGCICVFDVNSSKSLDDARRYLQIVIEENGVNAEGAYLVGNKIDQRNREVSEEQGREIAKSFGVNYMETSAKSDTNVSSLFNQIAISILSLVDQRKTIPMVPEPSSEKLQKKASQNEDQPKRCC